MWISKMDFDRVFHNISVLFSRIEQLEHELSFLKNNIANNAIFNQNSVDKINNKIEHHLQPSLEREQEIRRLLNESPNCPRCLVRPVIIEDCLNFKMKCPICGMSTDRQGPNISDVEIAWQHLVKGYKQEDKQ